MLELLRCGVLAVLAFNLTGYAQSIDHGASGSSRAGSSAGSQVVNPSTIPASQVASILGKSTCPNRTVNYLTHTLPQQCLRTDRVPSCANVTATSNSQLDQSETLSAPFVNTKVNDTGSASNVHNGIAAQEPPDVVPTSTTVQSGDTGSTNVPDSEVEPESPLDKANFLSFEEWKKQNTAKLGQDQGRNIPISGDRQRPGIHNALDTLGDEGEIELDFSGFGVATSGPSQHQAAYRTGEGAASEQEVPASQTMRSKDAGKTCKERTNYASFDCAATILKNNPECKSAASILVENKDSYMLNTCSAQNKFFIVELCNDILIDTVVLANYEFFSSIFRHFRVSVSDRYPVKMDKWRDLGTFEARNTREVQAFLIEHPQIWARYLRIEFLTHYASEYYCPVSLLRVHGTTMLEEIRPQEETSHGDGENEEGGIDLVATEAQVVTQEPAVSTDETAKGTLQAIPVLDLTSSQLFGATSQEAKETLTASSEAPVISPTTSTSSTSALNTTRGILGPENVAPVQRSCPAKIGSVSGDTVVEVDNTTQSTNKQHPKSVQHPSEPSTGMDSQQGLVASENTNVGPTEPGSQSPESDRTKHAQGVQESSRNATSTNTTTQEATSSADVTNAIIASGTGASSANATSANATRIASTPSTMSLSSMQPLPSTQESFFKSISKRLQQLESNSTLSLQYIEEQSRILRDAFSKVEKRQITATSTFLTHLNETVTSELRGFRQAYDQLWQSTVIELEGQREQYQREMLALSSRLTMVADELVWQKRMGIVQSTLLLLCLGLVLFARTGNNQGYLEVPLVMQQMMNKSSAALSRAGWESPPASPSPESRSPVSLFRKKLWRSNTEPGVVSGDVTDGTDSRPESKDGPVGVNVEPPTPPDENGEEWEGTKTGYEGAADDEEEVMLDPRQSRSSPATPTGTRDGLDKPPDITNGVGIAI